MATKRDAERAVSLFGGSIDWDASNVTRTDKTVFIDAPEGHVWQFNGCSEICFGWYSGCTSEFWSEVIDAIEFGVEPGGE